MGIAVRQRTCIARDCSGMVDTINRSLAIGNNFQLDVWHSIDNHRIDVVLESTNEPDPNHCWQFSEEYRKSCSH